MLISNFSGKAYEVGCDEAGRGCLAGPVFAAAVVFQKEYANPLINDSKQLTQKKREELAKIIERDAVDFAVSFSSQSEIDSVNILNASFLAMHRAIEELDVTPQHILVDGNRFKQYKKISHSCIVKGDGKYLSIAAASILAKVYRDQYMEKISFLHPMYKWAKNKGYPTKEHRFAIATHGDTKHHRKSFRVMLPGSDQLVLPLRKKSSPNTIKKGRQ